MAPWDLETALGGAGASVIYLLIGFGFGFILESAGFGDSRRLAAQFYWRNLTVIKVMLTAIMVAMILIFWSTALGWLDYDAVWVNPTYLWPGIAGGLIMGGGFVLGGFCPGTSLVGAATLKLDAIWFIAGAAVGIVGFGETVSLYNDFWNSSHLGRLTLPDWLELPAGVVILALVSIGILILWIGEIVRRRIHGARHLHGLGAGLLLLAASGLVWHGQPGPDEKWGFLAAELGPRLTHREVQIEPAELLSLMHDDYINLILIDVRDERDWNLFHLWGAERLKPGQLLNGAKRFRDLPENSVIVLVSNDELAATEVWKQLMAAASRPNAYVLAGGINRWLNEFTADGRSKPRSSEFESPDEKLRHSFEWALGSRHPASLPDPHHVETQEFTKKVKLLKRVVRKGGCG